MWGVGENIRMLFLFPLSLFNHIEFQTRQMNLCVLKGGLFSLCVSSLNRPIKEQIGWRSHGSLPPCGLGNTKPISQLHQDHPRQHHRPAVSYLLKSKVRSLTNCTWLRIFCSRFLSPEEMLETRCAAVHCRRRDFLSLLGFPGAVCAHSAVSTRTFPADVTFPNRSAKNGI